MKYYKNDTEITKDQAYRLIKEFVRWYWKQDFADYGCEAIFTHPKWNRFEIVDQLTGERHIISSKHEDFIPAFPSDSKQLSLFQ
jgi:hypothetical protein